MDNFASIFSCDNKKNTEIIFAMPFIEGEASNDGGRFLYQDAVFLGQAYGRNGKVIEKDTLNLKGTGGVFRESTLKISGKRSKKETAAVMPHSWSIT